jgi:DNA-binding transcriptional regulator YiaG
MTTFPATLKRWRRRRGLSQSQAARLLGVPVKSLQNWEHGRNTPGTLARAHLDQLISS